MSDGLNGVHTGRAPAAGATLRAPAGDARPAEPWYSAAARLRPVAPPAELPPRPAARPRIVDELAILGLSRVSRGRFGSRLFTGFFVFVFVLIAVQMVVAILTY